MRSATILALAIASSGLLPLACTQNFDFFSSTQGTGGATSSSSSGTMASSSSSSTSSSSSSSGTTGCTADSQCDDTNPCTIDTCTTATGMCLHTNLTDGATPLGFTETPGTCQTEQCMGGTAETVPDDTNAPTSGTPCVKDGCSMGNVTMTNVTAGMGCGANNQICDGMGNCVGCNVNSDCQPPGTCKTVACTTHMCMVGNTAPETGCGGGKVCDGQGNCVGCVMNSDCASGNCTGNTCGLAMTGHACTAGNQCTTGHCANGVCCDQACTATCKACTAALTGPGGMDGTCGNVTAGTTAPAGQCTAATCGNTGNCAAGAVCEVAASGSDCGPGPTCTQGVAHLQQTCGGGACGTAATMTCSPYTCGATTCRTMCNNGNQPCAQNYTCVATVCLLSTGQPCTVGSECASGMCGAVDAGILDAGLPLLCE